MVDVGLYNFWVDEASGRENPCYLCKKRFKKGEKRISIQNGTYMRFPTYSRFHYICFLIKLVKMFPELDIKDNKIKKEIVLRGIKNG